MYKRVNVKKLGRKKAHRELLIKNQIRTLFKHGILKTTTVRAKAVKAEAQSLVYKLNKKEISLNIRRKMVSILGSGELLEKTIKYAKKKDTGVKVIKTGFRAGDNAEMSKVELINFADKKKEQMTEKTMKKGKKVPKAKKGIKVNKDIDKKGIQESIITKETKSERKSIERVRTRSGL